MFKNLYKRFAGINSNFDAQCVLYSIYVSSFFALYLKPKLQNPVKDFDGVIGLGIIHNWDVSSLIANFYLHMLLCAIGFFFFYKFFHFLKSFENQNIRENLIYKQLTPIAVIGLISHCLTALTIYKNSRALLCINGIALIIFISHYLICLIPKLKQVRLSHLQRFIIVNLSLSYIICSLHGNWNQGNSLLLAFSINQVLFFIYHSLSFNSFSRISIFFNKKIFFSFCLLPLLTSIFTEIYNVLLHREFIIKNPLLLYFVVIILAFFAIAVIFKSRPVRTSVAYCLFILGLGALHFQPNYHIHVGFDIFESANYSVLISDFFFHDKLPLVEHYGGHMLSGVLEGILYGYLNSDPYGAIFSPYSNFFTPFIYLALFLSIRLVFKNSFISFLTIFSLPFLDSIIGYYGLGLYVCLTVAWYTQKKTNFRAFAIIFSCFCCILYRLDLGFAMTMGAVISLVLLSYTERNIKIILQLAIPAFAILLSSSMLFYIVCQHNNIDGIQRILEFVAISNSNKNWAYNTIGDSTTIAFGITYLLFPVFLIGCIALPLIKAFFSKKEIGLSFFTLALGFSCIVNFQRALVRHSLAEMFFPTILFSGTLFLAICYAGIKRNSLVFLPCYFALTVFFGLLRTNSYVLPTPLGDASGERSTSSVSEVLKNRVVATPNRIVLTSERQEALDDFNNLLSSMLRDEESFIDFANKSFLYSTSKRESPVYVSQSPLQLSGELAQEQFISQLEKNKNNLPIAIFPSNRNSFSSELDGIPHVIRYYKVAEYLYQNYQPLFASSEYRIWVQKDQLSRYADLINKEKKSVQTFQFNNVSRCINCAITHNADNSISINPLSSDPQILGLELTLPTLQSALKQQLQIELADGHPWGEYQLFYSKNSDCSFTEQSSFKALPQNNHLFYQLPVGTKCLRLDPPDVLKQTTLKKGLISTIAPLTNISYGYDADDQSFHNYQLYHLPVIWGTKDTENLMNEIKLKIQDNFIELPVIPEDYKKMGNNLVISISALENLNNVKASLNLKKSGGVLYSFEFTVKPGIHKYLFRVSSDYFWYSNQPDNIEFSIPKGTNIINAKLSTR